MDRSHLMTAIMTVALLATTTVTAAAPPRSPHGESVGECQTCHSTVSWNQVTYDHLLTVFSLEGSHADAACTSCHQLENFAADGDCMSCHVDGHEGALASDCAQCHDPQDWRALGFEHDMTTFPLWGAHGAADCVQCHANEVTWQFGVPPEACMDCHETDFGLAPVVVHLTAGPDCETCHTLNQWSGGHDPMWYEIRSGPHEVDCARCHKRAPDYPSYTCADCHKFSLEEEEHRGIPVEDARCLDCHSGDFGD